MRPSIRSTVFIVLLGVCQTLHAQPRWQVESASVVFEITNAGLPVHGSFAGLEADLRFDPDDPEHSVVFATVDASTVDTGIGLRNRHLRKRDYFHVDLHPCIRMESVRIEKQGSETFSGTFLLDIKGIQREVTFPFTFTPRGQGGRLVGDFTINRLDFGLGKSSVILADDVTVHLAVEVSEMEP